MSSILFNETPLTINVELATLIGLHESIILQQFNYWIVKNQKRNKNFHDGRYWTYNTYSEWHEQFPFWGESTVRRLIGELEKKGILVSGNYNETKYDRTKWYSIDYDQLEIIRVAAMKKYVDKIANAIDKGK